MELTVFDGLRTFEDALRWLNEYGGIRATEEELKRSWPKQHAVNCVMQHSPLRIYITDPPKRSTELCSC